MHKPGFMPRPGNILAADRPGGPGPRPGHPVRGGGGQPRAGHLGRVRGRRKRRKRRMTTPAGGRRSLVSLISRRPKGHVLTPEHPRVTPDSPLFWSTWGRRTVGLTRVALQDLWANHWLHRAQLARPPARRRGRGARAAPGSGKTCVRPSGTRASTRLRSTRASARRNSRARLRSRASATPISCETSLDVDRRKVA